MVKKSNGRVKRNIRAYRGICATFLILGVLGGNTLTIPSVSAQESTDTEQTKSEDGQLSVQSNGKEDSEKAVAEIEKSVNELNEEMDGYLKSYNELKMEQYKANNRVEKLYQEIAVMEEKIADNTNKKGKLEEELKGIEEKLTNEKSSIDAIARKQQLESKGSVVGVLRQLFSKETITEGLMSGIAKGTIAEAQKEKVSKVKELKEDKEKAVKSLDKTISTIEETRVGMEKAKEEVETARNELQSNDKANILRETESKIEEIRTQLESKKTEIEKLQESVAKVASEKDESQPKELERKKEGLDKSVKELENKYQQITGEVTENVVSLNGKKVSSDSVRNELVTEAMKYTGVPYVWGGKTPSGFDCSGFCRYVYLQVLGIDIGSYTVPQESSGRIVSLDKAEPGDLLFWGERGSTHHVGIYLGNGQYIDAPTFGDHVRVQSTMLGSVSFAVKVIE